MIISSTFPDTRSASTLAGAMKCSPPRTWTPLIDPMPCSTPTTRNGDHVLGYNIGGIVNLTEKHHVIFSAGTDIHGQNLSRYYAAYQLTWGPPEKKNGEEKK